MCSLSVFPSRTYLKLHNICVIPKLVKKVITNFDSSKASGPDYILMVVLKNCEPGLSYLLAELFTVCPEDIVFWRSHQWSLYLRMLWKDV